MRDLDEDEDMQPTDALNLMNEDEPVRMLVKQ